MMYLQYSLQDARRLVDTFMKDFHSSKVRAKSIVLYNSMIRGDFIDNRSDIDMFSIVQNKEDSKLMLDFYSSFCKRHHCGNEPRYKFAQDIFPMDFFVYTVEEFRGLDYGIYYWDFINSHKVLYGEDVSDLLKEPNPKEAVVSFLLEAMKNSEEWDNPSDETIKRHLGWVKFHPAYIAIECMKAVLVYHGIFEYRRTHLVSNLRKVSRFREDKFARGLLEIYIQDKTRSMNIEEVRRFYKQIYGFIRHLYGCIQTSY